MNVGWTETVGERGETVPVMTARAAEYVRMSTEHQKYSTENQAEAIQQYAARRGLTIVRTYADAGKSGLRLDGRDALKKLIAEVQDGTADFTSILVYDVSRWGRFSRRRRERLLRIYLQAGRHQRPVLCRAVRERRQPSFDDCEGCKARDGRRIQPGAFSQGFCRPM